MKTLMIEATDKNYKFVNKFTDVTMYEFCGWLNLTGSEKSLKQIAKKNKVVLF
jgi:hypothetical protein